MSVNDHDDQELPEIAPEALPTPSQPIIRLGDEMITIVDDDDPSADPDPDEPVAPEPEEEAAPSVAAQAGPTEEDLRQREAWYQRQLWEAQEKSRASELKSAELIGDTLKFQLTASYEALKQARETGDASQQVDLERQIRAIEGQQRELGGIVENLQKPAPAPQIASRATPKAPQAMNGLAARYAENNAWLKDPKYASRIERFLEINREISNQGITSDSPKYYAELNRRIAADMPTLPIRDLDGKKHIMVERQRGAPSRSPVAGARGQASADARHRQAAPSKAINPIALAMLKKEGKDPSDPKVQAMWARITGGRN